MEEEINELLPKYCEFFLCKNNNSKFDIKELKLYNNFNWYFE